VIAEHRYVALEIQSSIRTAVRSLALGYDAAHFRFRPEDGSPLGRFDVCYVHQPRSWELLHKMGADPAGSLNVVDLQNDDHDLWEQRAATEKAWPLRVASRIYARRAAQKLHRLVAQMSLVFCVSEFDVASMLQREGASLASKFEVVPNGVDHRAFTPPAGNRRIPSTFVFVGSLDTRMNQIAARSLLDIWPSVLRLNPNAVLTLAGRNPPSWLESARSSTIRVVTSPPDVRPYLWEASAFVAPFEVGAGTKIKFLEAMSAGVPIIATRASMQGIPANPGEHYLEVGSRDEIGAAAARLFASPATEAAYSGAAASLAGQFDWSVIARRALSRIEAEVDKRPQALAGGSSLRSTFRSS
jgi:glycosyltransferase involved in cell wall biosynthesis